MITLKKLARGVMAATLLGISSLLAQSGVSPVSAHNVQRGQASFYSDYYNGRQMANQQRFYNNSNSCAHRTLRFGTVVSIRNTRTGSRATCVVRDRMPYYQNRVIDLSKRTFSELGNLEQGLLPVEISW